MLFSEYVERWKRDTLVLKARGTQDVWGSALKCEILPCFGAMEIGAVGNPDVKAFVADLSKRFAPKSVRNIWAALSAILNEARRDGLVTATFMPAFTRRGTRAQQPFVTPEEMASVIAGANLGEDCALAFLLAETGLRIGEVLGLRIGDIDQIGHTLTVSRSQYRGEDQETKTETSDRTISLSKPLRSMLAKMVSPYDGVGTEVVFPGLPRSAVGLRGHLELVMKRAGVEPRSPHAWRRGNATLMEKIGVPEFVADARQGHRRPQGMTYGLYSQLHQMRLQDREWAEKMGKELVG